MPQPNARVEKRTHKRFQAKDGAFAVMHSEGKMGQMLDISHGGLSLKYLVKNKGHNGSPGVAIFFSNQGFISKEISFETVSDMEFEKDIQFSSLTMRRCGIKFNNLSRDQLSQINTFIEKHTYYRSDK